MPLEENRVSTPEYMTDQGVQPVEFIATGQDGTQFRGNVLLPSTEITEYLPGPVAVQQELVRSMGEAALIDLPLDRARKLGAAMAERDLTAQELAEIMSHNTTFAEQVQERIRDLTGPMGKATSSDNLNLLVCNAMVYADTLADTGDPGAQAAYATLSQIEEILASFFPADNFNGILARRGAIRAAIRAGEHERAQTLIDFYTRELGISTETRQSLLELPTKTKPTLPSVS